MEGTTRAAATVPALLVVPGDELVIDAGVDGQRLDTVEGRFHGEHGSTFRARTPSGVLAIHHYPAGADVLPVVR